MNIILITLGFFLYKDRRVSAILTTYGLYHILRYEWKNLKLPYIITLFYPILPLIYFHFLDRKTRFRMIMATACHDLGSLYIGKKFGTLGITDISPGKTWEGFIGGCIISVLCNFLIGGKFEFFPIVIRNVISLVGDIFESYLKRRVGIKDSGTILGSHGGLLDRFDGLIMVSIFEPLLRILKY